MSKSIDLIFTRDFCLAMDDYWQTMLTTCVPKEFGAELRQQIIRFTGRAVECYRVRAELDAMKATVVAKASSDFLFSEQRSSQYRRDIDRLRELLKEKKSASKRQEHFATVMRYFTAMYPAYMLSVFLPFRWKEDFEKAHADAAKAILDRVMENRHYSEGMFTNVDTYVRELIVELLRERKGSQKYARVVRYAELEAMLDGGAAPIESALRARVRGYVLFQEELLVGKDFSAFLREHDFFYEAPAESVTLKGNVACKGALLSGEVQVILNADEIQHFKAGNIIVTSMTSPAYVQAMKGAKAIITDEGGITCHAAIVSRELGIPCIIGTRTATKMLHDGDYVEIDAEKGTVRKL